MVELTPRDRRFGVIKSHIDSKLGFYNSSNWTTGKRLFTQAHTPPPRRPSDRLRLKVEEPLKLITKLSVLLESQVLVMTMSAEEIDAVPNS